MLKKFLHEPLVHFLVIGGLLFLLYDFTKQNDDTQDKIVISKERIDQLVSEWEKKSLSVPTQEEKNEIIQKEIYQRVLYKEALKMGLDKNDNTIKGHLAQKMEDLVFDTQDLQPPGDEELKKFMQKHIDKYREDQKITFTQKMLSGGKEPFEKSYTLTAYEAVNIFGQMFSDRLFSLPLDGKTYKIESDYGVHEVRIIEKPKPKPKIFENIKQKLADDYLRQKREEKNSEIYEELKSQYSIDIEEK